MFAAVCKEISFILTQIINWTMVKALVTILLKEI